MGGHYLKLMKLNWEMPFWCLYKLMVQIPTTTLHRGKSHLQAEHGTWLSECSWLY